MRLIDFTQQNSLRTYIEDNTFDPWVGTGLEGYVFLGSKKQGAYGERFMSEFLESIGLVVQSPVNPGHDRIVTGVRTEFKFSVAKRDCKKQCINEDAFTFNHLAVKKDWERVILCGMNPGMSHMIWFTKQDFIDELALDKPLFKRQQGGKDGGNDDWCLASALAFRRLLDRPYIRQIHEW